MKKPTHIIKDNYSGKAFQVGEKVRSIGNGKYQALTKVNGNSYRKEGWVEDDQIEKI